MLLVRLFFMMIVTSFLVVAGLGLMVVLRLRHWLQAPDLRSHDPLHQPERPQPHDASVIEGEYTVLDETRKQP